MVVALQVVQNNQTMRWDIELSETELVWCDLLFDNRFSRDLDQLNQHVVDYRTNLKKHISQCIHQQRVFLVCAREKVRFDHKKRPKYNFITKKMTFRLLIGNERRPFSLAVKMAEHFFDKVPKPKVILDPKFITLISKAGEDFTLSIHDFLFSVGARLSLQSNVLATGCTPSPYWQSEQFALDMFTADIQRHIEDEHDLLVYLGDYILQRKEFQQSGVTAGVYFDADDEKHTPVMLMLSRVYALYFLRQNTEITSTAIKNAGTNLLRFMKRRHLTGIRVIHSYEYDSEYMRTGSAGVDSAPSHEFELTVQDDALMINGVEVYTQTT